MKHVVIVIKLNIRTSILNYLLMKICNITLGKLRKSFLLFCCDTTLTTRILIVLRTVTDDSHQTIFMWVIIFEVHTHNILFFYFLVVYLFNVEYLLYKVSTLVVIFMYVHFHFMLNRCTYELE